MRSHGRGKLRHAGAQIGLLGRRISGISSLPQLFVESAGLFRLQAAKRVNLLVRKETVQRSNDAAPFDFGYTKVMIDPTEAAFHRDWIRDYNSTSIGLQGRISDADARRALELVQSGFQEEFRDAYVAAGYEVVASPAPDVLRLRTAVLNIRVTAPDQMEAARTRSFAEDAGEATLVLEARDSMSNALLGRAVDRRLAGGNSQVLWRTRASNRSDFRRVFRIWAERSAQALGALRATPAAAAAAASSGQ
jgi:hypothetical protein